MTDQPISQRLTPKPSRSPFYAAVPRWTDTILRTVWAWGKDFPSDLSYVTGLSSLKGEAVCRAGRSVGVVPREGGHQSMYDWTVMPQMLTEWTTLLLRTKWWWWHHCLYIFTMFHRFLSARLKVWECQNLKVVMSSWRWHPCKVMVMTSLSLHFHYVSHIL